MVSATWEGMAVPVQLGAFPCERWRRGEVVAACRMHFASRGPRLAQTSRRGCISTLQGLLFSENLPYLRMIVPVLIKNR